LVEVKPEAAQHLLTVGLNGKRFQEVTEQDVTRKDVEATNSTLGARAETFARGTAESLGTLAQVGAKVTPIGMLGGYRAAGSLVGVDVTDLGRSLPAQVAGLVGGEGAEQSYAEREQLLRQVNPGTYAGGQIAGQVAGAVATGGATTAAGRAMAGTLAGAGVRQGVARALGTGAAMAAEGGLYGAATAETQAREAGQTDGATAEQLLQGIGLGALLGGGIGAAGSGASSLFKRIAASEQKAVAPIAAQEARAAKAAMGGTAEDSIARLSSQISGAEYETLAKYGPHVNTPEAQAARALWKNRDSIIESKISPMSKDLQAMQDAFDPVTDIVRNPSIRKEFVEQLPDYVKPKAAAAGATAINGTISGARELLEALPKNEYTKASRSALQRFVDFGDSSFGRMMKGGQGPKLSGSFDDDLSRLRSAMDDAEAWAPAEPPKNTIGLYRAANDDYLEQGISFAENKSTAKQYQNNPGFGGKNIFEYRVAAEPEEILDLTNTTTRKAARTLNQADPGAIGIDEWLPRNSDALDEAANQGFRFIKVRESFPENTTTWIWTGLGDEPFSVAQHLTDKSKSSELANLAGELRDRISNELIKSGNARLAASVKSGTVKEVPWEELGNLSKRTRGTIGTASAADVNAAANSIKQEAQKIVTSLGDTATSGGASGEAKRYARETAQAFESNVQEPLRLHLEDETVWGVAGKGQKEINQRWVNLLGERGVLTRFQDELFGKGSKAYMSRRPYLFADTGKIKSWLSSAGTAAGETRQAMVRDAVDAIDDLATTIGKYHEMGPGQAKQLEALQSASKRMRSALADVDKTVSVANEIEHGIVGADKSGLGQLVSPGALAATGAFLAGPLGALAGTGIGMLARPGAAMTARQAIESVAGRFGAKTTGAASGWIKDVVGATKRTVERGANAVAKGTRPLVPAAVAQFIGKSKDLDSAYEQKLDELIQAQRDPEKLINSLVKATGNLAEVEPRLASALFGKSQAAIQFLASKAPAGTLDPTALQPNRKAVVSDLDKKRFARVWMAVEKPETVLADLRRGVATPDQIDALRTVHPETYQAIRETVVNALASADAKGVRLPLAVRSQLDLLLDLGGAGVPALGPEIAGRIQSIQAARAKQPKRQKKSPNLVASVRLPQQGWPSSGV